MQQPKPKHRPWCFTQVPNPDMMMQQKPKHIKPLCIGLKWNNVQQKNLKFT